MTDHAVLTDTPQRGAEDTDRAERVAARAEAVAAVAREFADAVDSESRFPREAIE